MLKQNKHYLVHLLLFRLLPFRLLQICLILFRLLINIWILRLDSFIGITFNTLLCGGKGERKVRMVDSLIVVDNGLVEQPSSSNVHGATVEVPRVG